MVFLWGEGGGMDIFSGFVIIPTPAFIYFFKYVSIPVLLQYQQWLFVLRKSEKIKA